MKRLIFVGLLAASLAVPYFLFFHDKSQSKQTDGVTTPAANQTVLGPFHDEMPRLLPVQLDYSRLPAELAPVRPLADVFNFQITPPWVLGNWPNVTTGIREAGLFGYRVPLVTGTSEHDVTGSLTYYFGPNQQLEQIRLQGDTGDARQLISIVTSQHGLARYFSNEREYLYRRVEKDKIISELRVSPETVVRSAVPYQRFEVSMTLSRPKAT